MWRGKTVSVVLPTYNEKDSIYRSIEDFFETGVVDEVLVINNNAAPGTSEEVARTASREIKEPRQGYGFAIQRGLREAVGDYLVVSGGLNGTFLSLATSSSCLRLPTTSKSSTVVVPLGSSSGAVPTWLLPPLG